jgi:hypothetical protein
MGHPKHVPIGMVPPPVPPPRPPRTPPPQRLRLSVKAHPEPPGAPPIGAAPPPEPPEKPPPPQQERQLLLQRQKALRFRRQPPLRPPTDSPETLPVKPARQPDNYPSTTLPELQQRPLIRLTSQPPPHDQTTRRPDDTTTHSIGSTAPFAAATRTTRRPVTP